jgi:uncharacterized protein (DUF2267 family)
VCLEVLGDRLTGGATEELAAQLPERDADSLRRGDGGPRRVGGTVDLDQRLVQRTTSHPRAADAAAARRVAVMARHGAG